MAKTNTQGKESWLVKDKMLSVCISLIVFLSLSWVLSYYTPTWCSFSVSPAIESKTTLAVERLAIYEKEAYTPDYKSFYDDPMLSYSIERPISNWDEKRRDWLKHHTSFAVGAPDRIFMVTGSQPWVCKNPLGDHFLLRLFKNKVDYCRIHGYEIFYNIAFMHKKMVSYWAKIPLIRAAMLAHPEAEWIWWVDSDAVFTDMDFQLPLDKYKNHNLVVDGWASMIYESRSWVGLNAGVLLFRNCQWSMDFMTEWANMGPASPNYEKWGQILKETLKDKPEPISDDQSALVYLLLKQKQKWGDKIYLENEYCFQGYWLGLVEKFNNITEKYAGIEKREYKLSRRRAEKERKSYSAMMEKYLEEAGYGKDTGRRPFITHFTGCQPCSGDHNPMYVGDSCWEGMERALNFADNQVIRTYGFVHSDLLDSSSVVPVPFDSPGIDI